MNALVHSPQCLQAPERPRKRRVVLAAIWTMFLVLKTIWQSESFAVVKTAPDKTASPISAGEPPRRAQDNAPRACRMGLHPPNQS